MEKCTLNNSDFFFRDRRDSCWYMESKCDPNFCVEITCFI